MRLPLLLLCLAACSGGGTTKREVCGNGIDDDGNGKTDCDDIDCAGQAQCPLPDAGNWGDCPKCGQLCVKQADCYSQNLLDERPLPLCNLENKCQELNQSVSVKIEYDANAWVVTMPGLLSVITTRWVSKTGRDGGTVSCADVKAASPANDQPLQLEDGGQFNMLGIDVTKLQGAVPQTITVPFAYVGTGANYMLFTEVWSGDTNSSTRLPTGSRRDMTGCIETGPWVTPLDAGLTCTSDGGVCRVIRPMLPPPS